MLHLSALCYLMGYGTGLVAFLWMAHRRRLATTGILHTAGAGLMGGLVGANVAQFLTTGEAGKTVLGGIAGGYLAVWLYKRHIGLRRPTGDLFAVALCAGEAIGRWGCFFGSCCYGKPTKLIWGVWQHDACRHPTQVYLSLASLAILGVLLWYERRSPPENFLFYVQGMLYCMARFGIEFLRDGHGMAGGLAVAQWACLGGFLFFALRFRTLIASQPQGVSLRKDFVA